MKCPNCNAGEIEEHSGLYRSLLRGFLNGALLFPMAYRHLRESYLVNFRKLKPITEYECRSCKALALVCPECSAVWNLAKDLGRGEIVSCPTCRKEFFGRLDT